MTKKTTPPEPAEDEHQGQGGSYVLDPKTGLRTLVERTRPAEDQPVKEQENGTTQA